ncbi:hypothetical protein GH714_039097 [Hevea brasiliensis]|uniref:Uncharacterized protein n=1 Tax=Hevea brasiliensis TaxID=3981 RepID=A0A6A6KN32_HEVBR|nr:hypothetical protein GH714_039097 [Hevea brasiliensis]
MRNSPRKKVAKEKGEMNEAYYTLKEKRPRFETDLRKQFMLHGMNDFRKQFMLHGMNDMEDLGRQTRIQLPR